MITAVQEPVWVSQRRIVVSLLPENRSPDSGSRASASTAREWPFNVDFTSAVERSQTRMVLSADAVYRRPVSRETRMSFVCVSVFADGGKPGII